MSGIVFAAARCQTKADPVGGTITGPGESFGIDKGLKPQDGVVVEFLPIISNGSGDEAKEMGGKMRHPHPWQNKEPGVVSQQVSIAFPCLGRPAEKGVATVHGVWCRGKGKTRQHGITGIGQILEMFANRLRIAEVVVLLNQTVEKLFLGGSSDLAQFDWDEAFDITCNRSLANFNNYRLIAATNGVIVDCFSWRQGDEQASLKLEQKPTADDILELSIGLPPVPGLTEHSGDSRTTVAPMFVNHSSDEGKIFLGDDPFAVGENYVHAKISTRLFS